MSRYVGIDDPQHDSSSAQSGSEIEGGDDAAFATLANWLCLAAAPTFAIMALLTAVLGAGSMDMLCANAQHGSVLTGMVPMYGLMSAFHAAPWLRLIRRPRNLTSRIARSHGRRTSSPS